VSELWRPILGKALDTCSLPSSCRRNGVGYQEHGQFGLRVSLEKSLSETAPSRFRGWVVVG
jgi:hypothetical protein